jgi:hypothetical protein
MIGEGDAAQDIKTHIQRRYLKSYKRCRCESICSVHLRRRHAARAPSSSRTLITITDACALTIPLQDSCTQCLGIRRACQRRCTVLFHRVDVVRLDGLWRAIELRDRPNAMAAMLSNTNYQRKLDANTTSMLRMFSSVCMPSYSAVLQCS